MIVFLGLCVGNFIYQSFTDQVWIDAIRVSLFQAVAIFVYWAMGELA